MPKILFLYTRLPAYFYECIQYLIHQINVEVMVVEYDPDVNSPYNFQQNSNFKLINKSSLTLQMVDEFQPTVIYTSGWGDDLYKTILKTYHHRVHTILGLDNLWYGNLKQRLSVIYFKLFLKKYWKNIWIPGKPQETFAKQLGYRSSEILRHLYCADTKNFIKDDEVIKKKQIIFAGRLVDYKRPDWVVRAFQEILNEYDHLNDWQLLIVGNGPLKDGLISQAAKNPNIHLNDFMQPIALAEKYKESAIFSFPSKHEHWGLVVQEAAAAGLVLLTSDTCGAASTFLESGVNGYTFESDDYTDFKHKLTSLLLKSSGELSDWQKKSMQFSQRITHQDWVNELLKNIPTNAS